MMHSCCNQQMGECTCGSYHTQSNSYMLFSMPNSYYESDHMHPYAYYSSSPSSSVDCTLSLGTPSTRLSEDDEKRLRHESRPSSFSWDILHTKNTHKTATRAASNTSDPLLARRCANCDTTSTPLWRNGPRGPKSLCNACGIRYKKQERRATLANSGNASISMEQQYYGTTRWVETAANEFRFIEESDDQRDSDSSGIPFLSWTLNSPGLVHHFTA